MHRRGLALTHYGPDFIMSRLPYPKRWPETAIAIADALSGNVSTVLSLLGPSTLDMERRAVSCNDNNPFSPPSSETIVDTWLKNFQEITHFAFSFPINEPDAGCQYWPVTPPERYQGPWNKTLRNPILIISNTVGQLIFFSRSEPELIPLHRPTLRLRW